MTVRFHHGRNRLLGWIAAAVSMAFLLAPAALPQTLTTGAITGIVTDPTGAVVPNAKVTVTSPETGLTRTTTTGPTGSYTFAQLNPEDYKLAVEASGFRTAEQSPITVHVSQTASVNFKLEVGETTQTVEVQAAAPLIQTENPNTTTTVDTHALANLPNPGGDLTFEAQFAPGALMNSSGGYGNVEYNGLPSGSNNFTIDGLDDNDPFLNLNNSGATNLLLGIDAVQEVTVNTTSYSVDQGRLGSAQINYTTKSGTNEFHGALHEIWNGSKFNSADYFINAFGAQKPRSNVNEFGGSIGGPLKKDKLFFFTDVEGTRIVVPVVENNISYPSSAFQSYVLNTALPNGGTDPLTGIAYPGEPAEVPFYQKAFSLYGNQTGNPFPALGCPFDVGGGAPAAGANDGNGCLIHRTYALSNHARETLWTVRIDQNHGDKDAIWYRFQLDNGVQPTATDAVNPIFNAISLQPERNGNVGWTHTFSPTLVNQFTPGFAWYTAIFGPPDLKKTLAAYPIVYPFGSLLGTDVPQALGGIDFVWPQGRDITQWQLIDNLSWTRGRHDLKIGENMRRVLVSDHDFGFFNTPLSIPLDLVDFGFGATGLNIQSFPVTLSEPIGIVNFDAYVSDTFKVTPKLTFTYGVRATWNADPKNQHNLYARPEGDFYSIAHGFSSLNTPLNQDIKTGLALLFTSTPRIFWQPRGAIAYQITPNTVYRAGFGVFSDIFPASLADSVATNPPYDPQFLTGVLFGAGIAVAPGVPGSAVDAAVAQNQTFQSAFSGGALSCVSPNASANCVPQVGLTTLPSGQFQYPYFLQWSTGIEHEFTNNWAVRVQYVGTRQVHSPYTVQPNGFETACPGCFSPWPFFNGTQPISPTNLPGLDARFSSVTQYVSGAGSYYHGLQVNATKRLSHGLQFAANYTYSHCIDYISNGGIFAFANTTVNAVSPLPGELNRDKGNCDYDVRHAFNGNYLYELPFHSSRGWMNQIIGGWQISGTVFLRGGFPFSVFSNGITNANVIDGGGPNFGNQLSGVNPYSRFTNIPGVTQSGQIQWWNPSAFVSAVDTSTHACVSPADLSEGVDATRCQYGTLGRNTLRAPQFRWSDFFLTKRFKLSEKWDLRVDGQFYNVFNHPNFTFPGVAAGVPGVPSTLTGAGTISSEVTPPTGLLGSFLGGDNAVRMIAFQARLEF